jgi:hypothetical protein
MVLRRIGLALLVMVMVATACGGDDGGDSGGITIDEPIGAPQPGSAPQTYDEPAAGGDPAPIDAVPSVAKTASVEVDVVQDDLNSAAQAVVDVATDPKVGGFLVSSVVDLNDGYGIGSVVVQVPSARFEQVVGDLGEVGDVTRQQLEGQDLTPEFLDTRGRVVAARRRVSRLLSELQASDNAAQRFELRGKLGSARDELRSLQQNEASINGQTAYSAINVSLTGRAPALPPKKPAFQRALATSKSIAIAIASGVVLAAGVVVPLGLLALVLYVVAMLILRRLKPRLES